MKERSKTDERRIKHERSLSFICFLSVFVKYISPLLLLVSPLIGFFEN